MSVQKCSRLGCEEILCNTYVDYVGYICKDCQYDFKQQFNNDVVKLATSIEINAALADFIKTRKMGLAGDGKITAEDFFKHHKLK